MLKHPYEVTAVLKTLLVILALTQHPPEFANRVEALFNLSRYGKPVSCIASCSCWKIVGVYVAAGRRRPWVSAGGALCKEQEAEECTGSGMETTPLLAPPDVGFTCTVVTFFAPKSVLL